MTCLKENQLGTIKFNRLVIYIQRNRVWDDEERPLQEHRRIVDMRM